MITKEQWDGIENALTGYFARVKFRYQEREIIVSREGSGEGRRVLVVYVDGYIKGGWTFPDSESFDPIARDVWRERKKAYFSPAKKAKIIKEIGKRAAKRMFSNFDDVMIYYTPDFTSAKSLVRQFKKLEGVEIIPPNLDEIAS